PWVKRELAAARAKLRAAPPRAAVVDHGRAAPPHAAVVDHGRAAPPRAAVVDRESLDGWLRDAAPPEVPFEVAVLPGRDLASRFPDGPSERRSGHLIGKLRMTHRAIPSEAVVVIALFSDVSADYV